MPKSDKEKQPASLQSLKDKIDQSLLNARRIFISDAVDACSAHDIIRKVWYLELNDPGKPILFVINSPGGAVDSGFAIWDQLKMISSPITTLITGLAASMGSVLSLSATNGRRFATPHSRIMIHQPSIHGLIKGQATDLEIQAKEIIKTKDVLIQLYMDATGRPRELIEKALDRDTWMSAQEALEFGLIDKVVHSFEEINA